MEIPELTLEEVISREEEVDKEKGVFKDKLANLTDWDTETLQFTIGGEKYNFTSYALRQLLSKFKIPYNYFIDSSPELRNKELTEGLQAANKNVSYIFKIIPDSLLTGIDNNTGQKTVYGIIPQVHLNFQTSEFLKKIQRSLPDTVSLIEEEVSLEETRLRFISKDITYPTKDGSQYIPASDIHFSEVGAAPYSQHAVLINTTLNAAQKFPQALSESVKIPLTRFNEQQFDLSMKQLPDIVMGMQSLFIPVFEALSTLKTSPTITEEGEFDGKLHDIFKLIIPGRKLQSAVQEQATLNYKAASTHTLKSLYDSILRMIAYEDNKPSRNPERIQIEKALGNFIAKLSSFTQDYSAHNKTFEYSLENIEIHFKAR